MYSTENTALTLRMSESEDFDNWFMNSCPALSSAGNAFLGYYNTKMRIPAEQQKSIIFSASDLRQTRDRPTPEHRLKTTVYRIRDPVFF